MMEHATASLEWNAKVRLYATKFDSTDITANMTHLRNQRTVPSILYTVIESEDQYIVNEGGCHTQWTIVHTSQYGWSCKTNIDNIQCNCEKNNQWKI